MYSKVLAGIRDEITTLPDTHFLEVLTFVRVNGGSSLLGMKRLQKRESFDRLESLGRLLKKEDPGGSMALAVLEVGNTVGNTVGKPVGGAAGEPVHNHAAKSAPSKPSQSPKLAPGAFKVSQICRPIEWMRV